MTENKRFWCLDGYEGETSPIVDGKFTPTNLWLCNKLNELYEENSALKIDDGFKNKAYSELLDSFMDLKKKYQTLKKDKQMLKIVDDYLLEYDGDYFDMHKPSNIRSLVYIMNRLQGFGELESEGRIE